MHTDFDEHLKRSLSQLNIAVTEGQLSKFYRYYELLTEWNAFMNLTAITGQDDVIDKHFADSILLSRYTDLNAVESVIDIGTGAGFPSVPLKIIFPHIKLTLVDSLNKRIRFLDTLISSLELRDVSTIHSRAETLAGNNEYRERYDLCVSRAVANLSSLSELCLPFVRCGGYFISYKGNDADEEIKNAGRAINILGGIPERIEKTEIPYTDISRTFVIIGKEKNTPKKYPRKEGTPVKDPL
ncbi:MAG: 16S rRNA (guanine(527)-N(7))-methyltransferase RsmG [Lachnospiraceae bacterium]|nr:16S rRNA (guanine(527)-N(7))-methyltransferase RsmG [Lachnospiraceae bacterium]